MKRRKKRALSALLLALVLALGVLPIGAFAESDIILEEIDGLPILAYGDAKPADATAIPGLTVGAKSVNGTMTDGWDIVDSSIAWTGIAGSTVAYSDTPEVTFDVVINGTNDTFDGNGGNLGHTDYYSSVVWTSTGGDTATVTATYAAITAKFKSATVQYVNETTATMTVVFSSKMGTSTSYHINIGPGGGTSGSWNGAMNTYTATFTGLKPGQTYAITLNPATDETVDPPINPNGVKFKDADGNEVVIPSGSDVITYTHTASGWIDDIIDKAGSNPTQAADDLKALPNADIAAAMTSNRAFLEAVKEIENTLGVTVNQSVTSNRISGPVEIVGAALNATGNTVTLKIGDLTPQEDANIVVDNSQYFNWVKVNIELEGAISGELDVPVLITMPIPTGVSPSKLTILHYRGDGSMEVIRPVVNGNYATFTVTGFSTFVFVNQRNVSDDGPGLIRYASSDRSSDTGTSYLPAPPREVEASVNGDRVRINGQTALGLVRVMSGDQELVRGEDYTVKSVDNGVEIRILKPGRHDLHIEFINAYVKTTITIDHAGRPNNTANQSQESSTSENVNANPGTGR